MHIAEGVLSPPVLIAGAVGAAIGITIGLKSLKSEQIPKVALLTSAFFVASLIHVPVGPSSSHLVLNGLLGIILGWQAFPAIFIGLTLQAILFQFGGLTTLGINTVNMAVPAVVVYYVVRPFLRRQDPGIAGLVVSGLAGGGAVMLSALLVTISLALSSAGLEAVGKLIFLVHIPIAVVEAIVSASVVAFLLRVRPEVLAVTINFKGKAFDKGNISVLAALFFVFLCCAPAHAHRVNVFAWFDGEKVEMEGYFASGQKAIDSKVIVTDQNGKVVLQGKTNKQGQFSFVPKAPGRYHIVLEAGMGHKAETDVDVDQATTLKQAESKKAALDTSSSLSASTDRSGSKASVAVSGPPAPTTLVSRQSGGQQQCVCVSAQEIDKILSRRLEPIHKELVHMAELQSKVKPRDVIAGLGYIFGLMGIALYFSNRKKGR